MSFSSLGFVLILFVCGRVSGDTVQTRSFRQIHLPFLGIGPYCNGCPPRFCDDDPAIVQGYCCGCARFYDNLPVVCPQLLSCPINLHNLCQHYEYMMYCCCGNP